MPKPCLKKKYHRNVAGSQNDPCVFCGRLAETIDHINPSSKGGTGSIQNLAPMCKKCNNNKSDSTVLMALLNPKIRRRMENEFAQMKNQIKKAAHQQRVQEEWAQRIQS